MINFGTVESVCELVTDGTHYTPKDIGAGIPFLTVKDVTDATLDFSNCSFISDEDYHAAKTGNSAPQKGDILFSKDGTVGKVHIVNTDKPFAVLSSLAILRPNKKLIESQYLGNVLRLPLVLDDAIKKKTGSAIRRIILADLKRVRFPLPPIAEQKRIAEILDRTQSLISKRKEAIALLDTLTQSIFLEMFGDHDSILNLWQVRKLGDLLDFLTTGSRGWAAYYAGSGDLFLRIQNVRWDELLLNDIAFVKAPQTQEASRTKVHPGDVLLSMTADIGRTAVIPEDIGNAYINQHLAILRTKSIHPQFLSSYFASPFGKRQVQGRNRQGVKAGLNFDDVRSFLIPCPPNELQKEFAQRVEAVKNLKATHRASLSELQALFASLQHKAFRGEL